MRQSVISAIRENKLIAIVRGQGRESLLRIGEALWRGGVRLMEITYNHRAPETFEETAETIAHLAREFEGRLHIGAGTVLSTEQVELTRAAGGRFIISPNVNPDVIRKTASLGMVSIPGAMTSSESLLAHDAGADFIKLFPIGELGAGYLRALTAPLSHIEFLAVGGVSPDRFAEYAAAGAVGFGVGGDLVPPSAVASGRFDLVAERAGIYTREIKRVYSL